MQKKYFFLILKIFIFLYYEILNCDREYSMFEIYKDKSGKSRFRLRARNGEIICASQGYASRSGCMKGVKSLAKNSASKESFDTKQNRAGKWSFNVKAANNKVIATSQSYADKASMNRGIKSVMTNAPKLKIK